jgi:hypothetical protein
MTRSVTRTDTRRGNFHGQFRRKIADIDMKIETNAEVHIDQIVESLQNQLTTKQLVDFAMQLGDDLTDQEEYYALLTQKLSKIKYD